LFFVKTSTLITNRAKHASNVFILRTYLSCSRPIVAPPKFKRRRKGTRRDILKRDPDLPQRVGFNFCSTSVMPLRQCPGGFLPSLEDPPLADLSAHPLDSHQQLRDAIDNMAGQLGVTLHARAATTQRRSATDQR
jgi:hypothetical protein